MLAATPDDLVVRRRAIAGSGVLQALATRLRTLVAPLLAGPVYLPDQKAQLSQTGGVCARDGSRLAFDPLSPSLHRCPACATEFTGEQHHRAWILRYHLWLSERAAHLAALGAVQGDVKCARRAAQLLDAYAARYRDYPNQDNVLGPTRLFFSTYLESIWLSQLVFAASLIDLVESGEGWHGGERERVRSMVAESVGIIGSFDEMWSNRQVWNNAAMIAAGRWLDEVAIVDRGLRGAHGLYEQMSRCVSSDGFWHEGENYHFFALRGILLAAEALRSGGLDLYTDGQVGARLRAMYHAPFLSVLPDLSLPARSDSPFGVSLRQQRFAELWEIGRARTGDGAVEAFLAELYDMDGPSGDDFGLSDIAELETNRPAQQISRASLGWKAFMWMDPSEPRTKAGSWRVGSQLLVEDGLAVLRSGPSRYASLECGPGRGGHGHPDLLHASLFWHVSWLADLGAGSYVSPSLAWYRSALAHNAPGVARVGQRGRGGFCAAFDQGDAWTWCRGVARNLFGGSTRAMRTLVVGPDYVVDVVDVEVPDEMEIDLPIHPLGSVRFAPGVRAVLAPASLGTGGTEGQEHGYDWVRDAQVLEGDPVRFEVEQDEHQLDLLLVPRRGETVFAGRAPGPPSVHFADGGPATLVVRRAKGPGRWVQLYASHPSPVRTVTAAEAGVRIGRVGGSFETIVEGRDGLRVRDTSEQEHELGGLLKERTGSAHRVPTPVETVCPLLDRIPPLTNWEEVLPPEAVHALGRAHYRRSERPYESPEEFSADVAVFASRSTLCFAATVRKPHLVVPVDGAAESELDNEAGDIHSDGLQCYVRLDSWHGFVVRPDLESGGVRARRVAGTAGDPARIAGRSTMTSDGYRMLVEFACERPIARGDRFPVNLVVNQMLPGRTRRAGQLVLSGDGEWVYLRGDREDSARAVIAEVS